MDEFLQYIKEREALRINKETKDKTIRECRFPNISWEHDRGTKYLYDFISDLGDYERMYYIFLFRFCGSNPRVLHQLTKIMIHDSRNIYHNTVTVKFKSVSPFKYIYTGYGFQALLLVFLHSILFDFYDEFEKMKDETIIGLTDLMYKRIHLNAGIEDKSLASTLSKDLGFIFKDKVNPDSKCWLDNRAQEGLKLVGESNLEMLQQKTSLNYIQLNNALVGYSCYVRYKAFYKIHGYFLERWKYYKG